MILLCMSALKYDPGIPKMATYLPLGASIMIMVNRDSKYMVGDDSSSLGIYNLCGLPYAHVLPFNFPHPFLLLYLLHVVPPSFVIFDAVRIQCYHHLHILYMCLILVHVWYLLFTLSLYPFLGYHYFERHIHSDFVHVMHELFAFSSGVG